MAESEKAILKLKDVVLAANGEKMKDFAKIKDRFKKDSSSGQLVPKSEDEMKNEAPDLTRGELLAGMLMNIIKPKDAKDAWKLNRLSKKVYNALMKDKGELHIEEDQLKEMIEFAETIDFKEGMQLTVGDVLVMLYEARDDLTARKNKDSK